MRRQPEHVEQALFFKHVALDPRTRDILITAVPNGGHRHKAVAAKLKAEGVKSGVPDVLCFEPIWRGMEIGYAGLAIEFKIKPNKPTPAQIIWLSELRARGWKVDVAYSADEAWNILTTYLGIVP